VVIFRYIISSSFRPLRSALRQWPKKHKVVIGISGAKLLNIIVIRLQGEQDFEFEIS
jgi:hypothetical protein